ncbi:unnamed protein product [Chrysoparadoxa australica]
MLAKQVVQARHAISRLYEGRAHLHSVQMELQHQVGMVRIAGCIKSSTAVMQKFGEALKIPEISQSMLSLGREMERAGLVEEIITDGLDSLNPIDETEAASEVDKVVLEITQDILQGAVDAPVSAPVTAPAVEADVQEEEVDLSDMKQRLGAL